MKRKIVFSFIVLLLISCSKKPFVIMEEYDGKLIKDANLLVVLLDQPYITNTEDVTEALGEGNPDEVYLKHFYHKSIKSIKELSTFSDIYIDTSFDQSQLEETKKELEEDKVIRLKIPKANTQIEYKDYDIDYVLFIQKLAIFRFEGESAGHINFVNASPPFMAGLYSSAGNFPKLVHLGKFTIWDNKLNKIVQYGKIGSEKQFGSTLHKNIWYAGIFRLVFNIFQNSPFKGEDKSHLY